MRRKLLGLLVAVILAITGTALLVIYVNGAEERAVAGEKVVDVLVVAQPIEKGTPANEIEGKVTLEHVPAKVRADDAVVRLSTLEGLAATADLVPGEQLISSRFAKPSAVADSSDGSDIDTSSLVKISFALDPERLLGGTLKPGDVVAVFVSTDDTKQTHLVLHQVPVVRVQGGSGTGGSSGDSSESQSSTTNSTVMVTLAVSAPSAERLVWGAEHGRLWLALEPATADQGNTRIVTPQDVFQ